MSNREHTPDWFYDAFGEFASARGKDIAGDKLYGMMRAVYKLVEQLPREIVVEALERAAIEPSQFHIGVHEIVEHARKLGDSQRRRASHADQCTTCRDSGTVNLARSPVAGEEAVRIWPSEFSERWPTLNPTSYLVTHRCDCARGEDLASRSLYHRQLPVLPDSLMPVESVPIDQLTAEQRLAIWNEGTTATGHDPDAAKGLFRRIEAAIVMRKERDKLAQRTVSGVSKPHGGDAPAPAESPGKAVQHGPAQTTEREFAPLEF